MVAVLTGNVLKDPDYIYRYHTGQLKAPDGRNIRPKFGNQPSGSPERCGAIEELLRGVERSYSGSRVSTSASGPAAPAASPPRRRRLQTAGTAPTAAATPPSRGAIGRASFTTTARPIRSRPLHASTARAAARHR